MRDTSNPCTTVLSSVQSHLASSRIALVWADCHIGPASIIVTVYYTELKRLTVTVEFPESHSL